MARPLALPIGSVRALVLLGLASRAILDLRATQEVAPWLVVAIGVSAAAYFAARATRTTIIPASPGASALGAPEVRVHHPLGLPPGVVRLLFIVAVGYGTWLWSRHHALPQEGKPMALVVGAFFAGVMVRAFLNQVRRPEDATTLMFEHAQALVALLASAGLVVLAATGRSAQADPWIEPALGAACTYYAGVR